MGIRLRLTILSFFQYFVWGAWLITLATYFFSNNIGSGVQLGAIFSTLALSSILMPAVVGIIADKWMNGERLYGLLQILYGACLLYVPYVKDADSLYYVIFGAMIFYMPTISLSNAVSFRILKDRELDVVSVFPPIRVWGTIGFIAAMWITNLTGSKATADQFLIGGFSAILLGIYSFSLPQCAPQRAIASGASLMELLGLNAFRLLAKYKMALFFIFSMFLGAALQLTNMYGDTFLDDFKNNPAFGPDSFVVKYSTIIMSISQISETVFILTIPFFLKRFGIKNVMLFSMIAWVLRFGLFAYGDPGSGLWMIILSCIVYGMAFDFFNISGSLFIETTTSPEIRASAQGMFMMITNGVGAFMGSMLSGYMIQNYYTGTDGMKDWHSIWLVFAGYALIVTVLFMLLFKHKHDPNQVAGVSH
jgi:NHS family xanthosine MFS transporter